MNAITVCVDYWDFLHISLPKNRRHFDRYLIVTTPEDVRTQHIATAYGCEILTTRAFYDNGASFNKYLPLEMGLDALGREGWIAILDADIIWPETIPFYEMDEECLYVPCRHHLTHPEFGILTEAEWRFLPCDPYEEFAGYSQIFHTSASCLKSPPWHETNWKHAGGGDSFFQLLWPREKKVRPPFRVLHMGEHTKNWCGRSTPFLTGEEPENAEIRLSQVKSFLERRVYHQDDPRRFAHEKF